MKLRIVQEDKVFHLVDEKDTHYGPPVSSEAEAESLLADWETYYAAPLRFIAVPKTSNSQGWVAVASEPEEPEAPILATQPAKTTTATNTADSEVFPTSSPFAGPERNDPQAAELAGLISIRRETPENAEMSAKPVLQPSVTSGGRPTLYFSQEERNAEEARRLRIKRAWIGRVGLEVYRSMVKDQNSAIHAFPRGYIESEGKPRKKPKPNGRKSGKRLVGIPYPVIPPEVTKQFEAYSVLKDKGYDVHAEVTSEAGRLDLVVFNAERKPRIVVEVKPRRDGWSQGQKQKYETLVASLGARLFLHNESTSLETLLEEVRSAMGDSPPLAMAA